MADVKVSALTADTAPTDDDLVYTVNDAGGTPASRKVTLANLAAGAPFTARYAPKTAFPYMVAVACSDMTTALTTGTTKAYWNNPWDATLTLVKVRATLATSGSGSTVVDVNEGAGAGTTLLSTKITIDASELDSDNATAPVISDSSIAADARITFDIDTAGTGAAGLIVYLWVTLAV
jgi:hypothetical protein